MPIDQNSLTAAQNALAVAKEKTSRLQAAHEGLAVKIDKYTADTETTTAAAKAAEQSAANNLAAAIADGSDAKTIAAAEGKLTEASNRVHTAARAASSQAVLTALEAQAAALLDQLETARKEQQKAQSVVDGIRLEALQAEWAATVNDLLDIGAELIQLLPENGFYYTKDMRIPNMKDSQRWSSRNDLLERCGRPLPMHG